MDEGTPVPADKQSQGDCSTIVCDGKGGTRIEAADDPADDANICTQDKCVDGATVHAPLDTVPCYTGPKGTLNIGQCRAGTQQCMDGMPIGQCIGEVLPAPEDCDVARIDEDCDGKANDSGIHCVCKPGELGSDCYSGPAGTRDVGICHGGKLTCTPDGLGYGGACMNEQTPQAETCDAAELDEDCDGQVNEEGANCVCGDGYVSIGEECDGSDKCLYTCKLQKAVMLAAGGSTTCAILSSNGIKCWGNNGYGQLGQGDTNSRGDGANEMGPALADVALGVGEIVIDAGAGGSHTCAVLEGGAVKCWGNNGYGQLGQGDTNSRGDGPAEMGSNLLPVSLGTGKKAVSVSVGASHSCALLNDGSVKCWGDNSWCQLGLGTYNNVGSSSGQMGDNLPAVSLGTGAKAVAVSAGDSHTCALLDDGTVKCWGHNDSGQLGRGDSYSTIGCLPFSIHGLLVVALGTGRTAVALSAGANHTCALLDDGSVKCWGRNSEGQLGLGDTTLRGAQASQMGDNLPAVNLGGGQTAKAINAGMNHTCALLDDGTVKCWGYNGHGQLALGSTSNQTSPTTAVDLGAGKTAVAISAGSEHSCAILNDGSVKCWGYNASGQLGQGDTKNRGDNANELGDNLPPIHLFSNTW
ncbi:MAG: hypothetical protein QM820_45680 [Minicystis sp.]